MKIRRKQTREDHVLDHPCKLAVLKHGRMLPPQPAGSRTEHWRRSSRRTGEGVGNGRQRKRPQVERKLGGVRSAGARETALLPKAQRRGEPPAGRQAGRP